MVTGAGSGIGAGVARAMAADATSVWGDPAGAASMCKLIPYGRIGETADVAPVAVWLTSDQADYITGTTIFIDGGMLLYPGFRTGG